MRRKPARVSTPRVRRWRSLSALLCVCVLTVWVGHGCDWVESGHPDHRDAASEPEGSPSLHSDAALVSGRCGVSGPVCSSAEPCTLTCQDGSPRLACRAPRADDAKLGESCGTKTCREGTCLGGQPTGPTSQCTAFCSSDVECPAGNSCQAVSIKFTCESGPGLVQASVCRSL
jgi:hypothetical protein